MNNYYKYDFEMSITLNDVALNEFIKWLIANGFVNFNLDLLKYANKNNERFLAYNKKRNYKLGEWEFYLDILKISK